MCIFGNHDHRLVAMNIQSTGPVRFYKCVKCGDRVASGNLGSFSDKIISQWTKFSILPENTLDPVQLSFSESVNNG